MQVILLEYPGVQGEVLLKDGSGAPRPGVACNSFGFDLSRKGDIGPGGYGDKNKKKPSTGRTDQEDLDSGAEDGEEKGVDRVSISRNIDKASPTFMKLAYTAKGDTEQEAVITVYRAFETADITTGGVSSTATSIADSAMKPWHEPFMKITLKDVHVAAHKINVTSSDISEDIEISFKEITFEYTVYKNGKKLGTTSGKVDISTGKPAT